MVLSGVDSSRLPWKPRAVLGSPARTRFTLLLAMVFLSLKVRTWVRVYLEATAPPTKRSSLAWLGTCPIATRLSLVSDGSLDPPVLARLGSKLRREASAATSGTLHDTDADTSGDRASEHIPASSGLAETLGHQRSTTQRDAHSGQTEVRVAPLGCTNAGHVGSIGTLARDRAEPAHWSTSTKGGTPQC